MCNRKTGSKIILAALAAVFLAATAGAKPKRADDAAAPQADALTQQKAQIDADLSKVEKEVAELRALKVQKKKAPESGKGLPACEKQSLVDAIRSADAMGLEDQLATTKGLAKDVASYFACQGIVLRNERSCASLGAKAWAAGYEDCHNELVMALAAKAMATRNPAAANAVCALRGLPGGLAGNRCSAWARAVAAGKSASQICADMSAAGGRGQDSECVESLDWISGRYSSGQCQAMEHPTERSLCRQFADYRKAVSEGPAACGRGALCEALVTGKIEACERQAEGIKTRVCAATALYKSLNDTTADLNVRFKKVARMVDGFEPKSDPWYPTAQKRLQQVSRDYSQASAGERGQGEGRPSQGKRSR